MDNQLGNTPIQKVIEGYLIFQQMVDNDILKEAEGLYAINGDGAIKYLEKQNLELQRENEYLKNNINNAIDRLKLLSGYYRNGEYSGFKLFGADFVDLINRLEIIKESD